MNTKPKIQILENQTQKEHIQCQNQLSRKADWNCTKTSSNTIKAATPHGELPSCGRWQVRLFHSHGDLANNMSGFSIDDSQRTRKSNSRGVAKSNKFICSFAVSTISSQLKYHDMPRKIEMTAKIRRTGYGRGSRVKASKIELLLLPQQQQLIFLACKAYYKLSWLERPLRTAGSLYLQQNLC